MYIHIQKFPFQPTSTPIYQKKKFFCRQIVGLAEVALFTFKNTEKAFGSVKARSYLLFILQFSNVYLR